MTKKQKRSSRKRMAAYNPRRPTSTKGNYVWISKFKGKSFTYRSESR